mmetsp:Transcript_60740/g.177441  ORF Transcript_60740/g.177441 Transcript_60740/m.177441 type:complete len:384 (+) Transcript_60740:106-1257(+)
MPLSVLAGMSSKTFLLFASGSSTCRTPARCAASTLSRMPPTGRTWPLSVTSPVTAVSLRMGRLSSKDARARSTATPAEGPSLGMPPAGKCTWTSSPLKGSLSLPASSPVSALPPGALLARKRFKTSLDTCSGSLAPLLTKRLRSRESAVSTLSVMTFPSWPVMVSRPWPAVRVASMKSSWPPTVETLRPIATPTERRSAMSGSKSCTPMMCGRCWRSTVMTPRSSGPQAASACSRSSSRSAMEPPVILMPCSRKAAQRQIWARRLSRERTPLSEVQLVARPVIASSVSTSRGGPAGRSAAAASAAGASAAGASAGASGAAGSRAWSRRCFGRRCVSVMERFSSTVYPESSMTSMRSSKGRSMREVSLAVQMKSTLDRSKAVFR